MLAAIKHVAVENFVFQQDQHIVRPTISCRSAKFSTCFLGCDFKQHRAESHWLHDIESLITVWVWFGSSQDWRNQAATGWSPTKHIIQHFSEKTQL